MTSFLALIGKDFLELRRDRLALSLMLVLPVLALVLFGYGIRLQCHNIPLAVFDQDKTSSSRSFIDALAASNVFELARNPASQNFESILRHGYSILILPPGFSSAFAGGAASANFFIDGTELNQARTTEMVCRLICEAFLPPQPTLASFYVIPKVAVWFNPDLHEEQFVVPGSFGVILWMFPSLLAAVATARELERAAVVQVYVSKVPAINFVIAKLVVYLAVGLLQALLLLALGCYIFQLHPIGNPLIGALCTGSYVASAVLFGIMLGATSRSQTVAVQAASTGGFFPSLLLSGFVYPLNNIPPAIQIASYLVPARYYITVARDSFNRGATWLEGAQVSIVLLIFAAVFFAVSMVMLRKMQMSEAK
jgi:ABC-2 type transport system permease protein